MTFDFEDEKFRKFLENISSVPFALKLPEKEEVRIGDGEPEFSIILHENLKKTDLLFSTSLTLGEAYMDGVLDVDGNLYAALCMVLDKKVRSNFAVNSKLLNKLKHLPGTKSAQKKQVTSHYDIGNDFYRLWLGKTMNYSCAYFKTENDTLDEAQTNKTKYILKKLNLKEGMSLLDIGCGWGDILIQAAKQYNVHGVGITLSEEQAKGFQERIESEHLENLVKVEIMDYRDLKNLGSTFDRVVSVGMLEHVGREQYDLFIQTVDQVLKPEGLFLLHFISGLREGHPEPWVDRYIFPAGVIPSLREILHICGDYNYYTLGMESLRMHYVKTLLCWYQNYKSAEKKVAEMFDLRFRRMWELYLNACAANFTVGGIDIHQILLSKGPKNDMPLTREYLYKN